MVKMERREVGPLFSWLPMRLLTRHGEIWLDQGSQSCAELDFRLAEDKKTTAHFLLFVGLSLVLGGKKNLCNQGRVYHAPPSLPQGRHIVSLEIGLYPQLSLCTLAKGQRRDEQTSQVASESNKYHMHPFYRWFGGQNTFCHPCCCNGLGEPCGFPSDSSSSEMWPFIEPFF